MEVELVSTVDTDNSILCNNKECYIPLKLFCVESKTLLAQVEIIIYMVKTAHLETLIVCSEDMEETKLRFYIE